MIVRVHGEGGQVIYEIDNVDSVGWETKTSYRYRSLTVLTKQGKAELSLGKNATVIIYELDK